MQNQLLVFTPMKRIVFTTFCLVVTTILTHESLALALDGELVIHDPSTVILCNAEVLHVRHWRYLTSIR